MAVAAPANGCQMLRRYGSRCCRRPRTVCTSRRRRCSTAPPTLKSGASTRWSAGSARQRWTAL